MPAAHPVLFLSAPPDDPPGFPAADVPDVVTGGVAGIVPVSAALVRPVRIVTPSPGRGTGAEPSPILPPPVVPPPPPPTPPVLVTAATMPPLPRTRLSPVRRGLARSVAGLPLLAMLLGLLVPELAALADRATPFWLAATTLLCVLLLPARQAGGAVAATLPAVLGLGLAAPLLCWAAAWALGVDPAQRPWLVLAAGAPVGTGAIGVSVALGLCGGRAVVAVIASTALAPVLLPLLTLPLLAAVPAAAALLPDGAAMGEGVGAASWLMLGAMPALLAERLWLLTVLPALLAWPLCRRLGVGCGRMRRGCAVAAMAVLAMTALARMHGLGPVIAADPLGALRLLGLACLPGLAGFAVLLLFSRGQRPVEALLLGGYRNISLVWVACEPVLTPEGRLLMALAALPVYATPALAALLAARPVRWRFRGRRGAA
ncbi:hypothetical protein [Roseomonas elaeocarpi]|uniref:Uncharacterized protein n=1 Tax=Roseomonas elaeocarpi TaxID=907779 RepID=A0ABV6JML7_9PROT